MKTEKELDYSALTMKLCPLCKKLLKGLWENDKIICPACDRTLRSVKQKGD